MFDTLCSFLGIGEQFVSYGIGYNNGFRYNIPKVSKFRKELIRDSLLELFQTIAVLICIYGISKLALSKKLKSFHIHFSVSNGFDLSATYDNISSEVTDNEE